MIRLIILFTGESCAGKDFTASICESVFSTHNGGRLNVRVVSISDTFKRRYAKATGADLGRLLNDRLYKEEHRPALTHYFKQELKHSPDLHEQTFMDVVGSARDADVILITGLREEAPVASYAHLVPYAKLVEVHVKASEHLRRARKECNESHTDCKSFSQCEKDHIPGGALIFYNNAPGGYSAEYFCKKRLLCFIDEALQRLAGMVATIEDWPKPDLQFRHVLGIAEAQGGLELCTSLMATRLFNNGSMIDVIACCESGGFVFAGALAQKIGARLAILRKAGKLPPPVVSVRKPASYISSLADRPPGRTDIEMGASVVSQGSKVLIVDDLLATGTTLCAMLSLLMTAGIALEDIQVAVVVELPYHGGRKYLHEQGFGRVAVDSLLVFEGQ